jgi:drug/metabolite transporter (DMT)-like permease
MLTVVTLRTLIAAGLIWVGMLLFSRHSIRSSTPATLLSLTAGVVNGIGSLFFYASLLRIDAALVQLINISYLVFVTLLLRMAGQQLSHLTIFRIGLTIFAIYLLTTGGISEPDWLGVLMVLLAAFTYAVQLVFSQRIMLDIPAPTLTLYAMTGMAGVVSVAWLLFPTDLTDTTRTGWQAIFAMGLATAVSRLTLFLGVKGIGSIQTALIGVLEVLVTITIGIFWLNEQLTMIQSLGALIIIISVLLIRYEKSVPNVTINWQRLVQWYPFSKRK